MAEDDVNEELIAKELLKVLVSSLGVMFEVIANVRLIVAIVCSKSVELLSLPRQFDCNTLVMIDHQYFVK